MLIVLAMLLLASSNFLLFISVSFLNDNTVYLLQ